MNKTLVVAHWVGIILPIAIITMILGFALDISAMWVVGLFVNCAIAGLFAVTGIIVLVREIFSSIRSAVMFVVSAIRS